MITRKQSFDALLVYLLLFVSGSHLFKMASDKVLILIFLFLFLSWAFFTDRKINIRFILYLVIFTGFLLIINLYTSGSLSLLSIIGTIIKLLVAYFILKIVGTKFPETYIHVVVVLALFSLFGYFTDTFSLFDGLIRRLPPVGDIGYEGFLYVYRFKGHIDRNSSIFFEPGAYQIFPNTALFFLLFVKTHFTPKRKYLYILILLVTLFTTFSTTGYLIFAVMFGLFVFKSDVLSASGKAALVGLFFVALLAFSAQFHSVIFDKIDSFLAIQHLTDKSDRRSFDLLIDLEIIKKHIFGVGYERYFREFGATGLLGEGNASSNGISKLFAVYGLPFGLFLLASYYWALNRLLDGFIMTASSFMMLLVFLIGESYYVFSPFCLAIIAAPFVYKPMGESENNRREAETI